MNTLVLPGSVNGGEECPICLETEGGYVTPCGHCFHEECIKKWWWIEERCMQKRTCPICRKKITSPSGTSNKPPSPSAPSVALMTRTLPLPSAPTTDPPMTRAAAGINMCRDKCVEALPGLDDISPRCIMATWLCGTCVGGCTAIGTCSSSLGGMTLLSCFMYCVGYAVLKNK